MKKQQGTRLNTDFCGLLFPLHINLPCVSSWSKISGAHVIPVALFHSLDGTRSEDYVARVEPSGIGGKKMAELLLDAIHTGNVVDKSAQSSGAPTKALIDRSN